MFGEPCIFCFFEYKFQGGKAEGDEAGEMDKSQVVMTCCAG